MKKAFWAGALRLLLLVAVGLAGLLTTACKDKNYVEIDEKLIKKYLSDNNINNAQRQGSGLYYVPLVTAPSAPRAVAGKTVSVLYTGTLLDGTVFDASSRRGNQPLDFILGRGQVIQGWDEGIALMRKGEKSLLLIPSQLGYGAQGAGSIPANTVLRFEVELVDVR
ncbi:FKBP-type peptidyl-prolyl cis-trans isomerase [Hymenobacter sp. BT664]|uniref:Peptidyl-prolyl cis-trans isomerase n=1 Tax=Hymenobacter montanus TaxID=2771359 RepID=A0A927BF99_9BACT|nr:FKBP-type peptidyl-prolyl cis-trans isomerase [Hymenobacter montanus]MBD2769008.1 FKBP-type peptidyl-prolyl cis-trans isomerase [Hymenobacter montanus]